VALGRWGGAAVKAFIGEPRDAQGNAVACARCDRRATTRVGSEPRCSWHLTESLPPAARNGIAASRRDRKKREAPHG
jgi:hypothetical protein